ncbi:phosphatase PAP2 family protein [Aurantibacillus circumpalustris]|uniref:phosphatase PAP2 family protein n=1 Tax=Aurantibacillus circumpalustris TaxID=3036359 RepID=UPI00295C054A|nr:phosphatase PAP2 family protein [Aurantibacillus circumpalustris]
MKKKIIFTFVLPFAYFFKTATAQFPYKLSWGKESILFATGFIVGITASAVDDEVTPLTQYDLSRLNKNNLNFLDRSAINFYSQSNARISDVALVTCIASPALLLAGKKSRNEFGIISVMYIETMILGVFLPSYGKGGVKRVRPFVYGNKAPLEEKLTAEAKRSFFSGHTTLAFSSAVFFSTVYSSYYPNSKYKPFVWGGSLLAASTVGFMRYRSGAHFPTDVLVGAAVGSLVGYFVPFLHKNKKQNDVTILPFFQNNRTGLSVVWNLN